MGKGACTFKETDGRRAISAAKKAGLDERVEIDLERKRMTLTPVKVVEPNEATESNEWDTD